MTHCPPARFPHRFRLEGCVARCPLPCLSHRPRLEGCMTHYTASPFSPVIQPLLPEGTTWAGRPRGHVVPFAAYLAKGEDKTSGLRVWRNSGSSNSVRRDGVSRTNCSNDGLVRQSRGSPNGIRKCQLPQLTQRLIRGAHQAPFCARELLKTGAPRHKLSFLNTNFESDQLHQLQEVVV